MTSCARDEDAHSIGRREGQRIPPPLSMHLGKMWRECLTSVRLRMKSRYLFDEMEVERGDGCLWRCLKEEMAASQMIWEKRHPRPRIPFCQSMTFFPQPCKYRMWRWLEKLQSGCETGNLGNRASKKPHYCTALVISAVHNIIRHVSPPAFVDDDDAKTVPTAGQASSKEEED